jgi:hypothetical protein
MEVCVIQDTQVYLELIQERGRKGLPLERVYKTLVLCRTCHQGDAKLKEVNNDTDAREPDAGKLARPVRRRGVGKVPAMATRWLPILLRNW